MLAQMANATPYGAAANVAGDAIKGLAGGSAPATSVATSGDAKSGDALGGNTSGITGGGVNFGGVNIGTDALRSPAQFASGYTSRRFATGATAAAMPTMPPLDASGVSYTSTVSASPVGVALAIGAGLVALLLFRKAK